MDTLQLSRNDFRFLLIAPALLPTLCFILGFYTVDIFNLGNINKEKVISTPLAQDTNKTLELKNKLALSEQTTNTPASIDVPVSSSASSNDTLTDVKILPLTRSLFVVQAGLFSKYENAVQFQSKLLIKGLDTQITDTLKNGKHRYRIILDSFKSQKAAVQFLKIAKEKHKIDLYVAHINGNDYLKTVSVL